MDALSSASHRLILSNPSLADAATLPLRIPLAATHETVLGRHKGCTVTVQPHPSRCVGSDAKGKALDPKLMVSRRHCALKATASPSGTPVWSVSDLGSSNGTWVRPGTPGAEPVRVTEPVTVSGAGGQQGSRLLF